MEYPMDKEFEDDLYILNYWLKMDEYVKSWLIHDTLYKGRPIGKKEIMGEEKLDNLSLKVLLKMVKHSHSCFDGKCNNTCWGVKRA
jgi:hypothetical protein